MTPETQHWIEVLGAALVGLGGWLYGIGRRYEGMRKEMQSLEREDVRLSHDMGRLEGRLDSETAMLRQEIAAVENSRSESASKLHTRLDEIGRAQAAQGAQITSIQTTCNRVQDTLDGLMAGRRAGGNRFSDPPAT